MLLSSSNQSIVIQATQLKFSGGSLGANVVRVTGRQPVPAEPRYFPFLESMVRAYHIAYAFGDEASGTQQKATTRKN